LSLAIALVGSIIDSSSAPATKIVAFISTSSLGVTQLFSFSFVTALPVSN
jgi:hypothetical protein